MEQQYHGMPVQDASGLIGTVVGVDNDPATGSTRLIVEHQDGSRRALSSDLFTVRDNAVYIHESSSGSATDAGQSIESTSQAINASHDVLDVAPGEEVRIPVVQEEVSVGTRKVERGGVRVHRLVNERTETVEQPTIHEHVDVERITVGRVLADDEQPQVREEGDTLIIPVVEEMLVVEKRLVLKEEVRITKHRSEEIEQVQVVLREEDVQIEQIEDDRRRLNQ